MKILLAPSETKNIGGEEIFNLEKLFLPEKRYLMSIKK